MYRSLFLVLIVLILAGCSSEPETIEDLKAAGEKAFLDSKYTLAREYFLKALSLQPSDRDLLFFTGVSYRREYHYDSALVYLRRADILYPADRDINVQLYEVALASESWDFAIGAIHDLVNTGDPLSKHLPLLVELYTKIDQPLQVFYWGRKYLESEPDDLPAYYFVVKAAIRIDSVDFAERYNDLAIERFGEIGDLIANRGVIAGYRGGFAEAEKLFRSLIARDSASEGYQLNLAEALSQQSSISKKKEALAIYKRLRASVPNPILIDSLITEIEQGL
jgi:tetratricopeptide (TPR) repeat protein